MRRRNYQPLSPQLSNHLKFYPFWENEFDVKKAPVAGTAIGAWGDSIASIAYAKEVVEFFELPSLRMIHIGVDENISKFIERQPWCSECEFIYMKPDKDYGQLVHSACNSNVDKMSWLPTLELSPETISGILPTNISYHSQTLPYIKIPEKLKLDPKAVSYASKLIKELRKDQKPDEGIYVLNPHSVQSTHWTSHWSFSGLADMLEYLLLKTSHKYILTGQKLEVDVRHKRLINLINQLPSMEYVYALSEKSDGVITCNNSLSMFSITNSVDTLVMCGSSWKERKSAPSYFTSWTDRVPNTFLEYGEPFEKFIEKSNELFERSGRKVLSPMRRFWRGIGERLSPGLSA